MYGNTDLARQYQQQQILNASAAQQVVMLYDGAIKFTLKARESITKGDIQERHTANRRAMEIVSYLLEILDLAKGGDVALRLQKVYSFLLRRYLEVDFKNDVTICDEILEHLRTLRGSWEQIARNDSQKAQTAAAQPVDSGMPAVRSAVA